MGDNIVSERLRRLREEGEKESAWTRQTAPMRMPSSGQAVRPQDNGLVQVEVRRQINGMMESKIET